MENLLAVTNVTVAEMQRALNVEHHHEMENAVNELISKTDNVEQLKALAVKTSGMREFFGLEDRLIDLMGEDDYDDFADEHGLS